MSSISGWSESLEVVLLRYGSQYKKQMLLFDPRRGFRHQSLKVVCNSFAQYAIDTKHYESRHIKCIKMRTPWNKLALSLISSQKPGKDLNFILFFPHPCRMYSGSLDRDIFTNFSLVPKNLGTRTSGNNKIIYKQVKYSKLMIYNRKCLFYSINS